MPGYALNDCNHQAMLKAICDASPASELVGMAAARPANPVFACLHNAGIVAQPSAGHFETPLEQSRNEVSLQNEVSE